MMFLRLHQLRTTGWIHCNSLLIEAQDHHGGGNRIASSVTRPSPRLTRNIGPAAPRPPLLFVEEDSPFPSGKTLPRIHFHILNPVGERRKATANIDSSPAASVSRNVAPLRSGGASARKVNKIWPQSQTDKGALTLAHLPD